MQGKRPTACDLLFARLCEFVQEQAAESDGAAPVEYDDVDRMLIDYETIGGG